jgi:hypothetical protein
MQRRTIYFAVEEKVGGDPKSQRPVADMIEILNSPASDEFFMMACDDNLSLLEGGISDRAIAFVDKATGDVCRTASEKSLPVLRVIFAAG